MRDVDLPAEFAGLVEDQQTVMTFEGARNYAYERLAHGELLSDGLAALLSGGAACPYDRYVKARGKAASCQRQLDSIFDEYDLLLTPSAAGEAPEGLDATGDPIFCRMWTLLHVPSVTVPISIGPGGLPIAAQFVARFRADDTLLQMARPVATALA